jgi:M6 family metalloprotease-like protein
MKRNISILIVSMIFSFLVVEFNWALIPPTKEQVEKYRQDGSWDRRVAAAGQLGTHRVSPALIARAMNRLRNLPGRDQGPIMPNKGNINLEPAGPLSLFPGSEPGLPAAGKVKILTILISFADHPNNFSEDYINTRLYGDPSVGYPYESLRNYYLRSSYNRLEIEGNVLGWYRTPYPRADVATNDADYTGGNTVKRQNLIKEVLTHYDNQGHDFTQYDNNGDGIIDYFIVVWTGPRGEWVDFWWAYHVYFTDWNFKLDGKALGDYSWQSEKDDDSAASDFGVPTIIHETGHGLGLPDFYDYDEDVGPGGGIGHLGMMDSTEGDHNCFSKFLLGWIEPMVFTSGMQTVCFAPSGTTPDAAIVMPGFDLQNPYAEFFMIQNRCPLGNDIDFTYPGLVIWHIDARLNDRGTDFEYDNSYTVHKLLRVMEADGQEEIETMNARFDAGDFYTPGSVFGPISSPSSAKYSGHPTAILVDGIQSDNEMASAAITVQNLARIDLYTERKVERSWLTKKAYTQLDITIRFEGTIDASNSRYVIYRKEPGEQYESIRTLDYSEFQSNSLTYYDKYFPIDLSYIYIVVAYDSRDHLIGVSPERSIEGEEQ